MKRFGAVVIISLLIILAISTIQVAHASSPATLGPTKLATSNLLCDVGRGISCFGFSYQHKTFYDTNSQHWWAFWVFWSLSKANLSCSTSADGATWSVPSTIAPVNGSYTGMAVDIYHDDSNGMVYYATANVLTNGAVPPSGFTIRWGTLTSGGCSAINWAVPAAQIHAPKQVGPTQLSITKDVSGNLWVAYSQSGSNALLLKCSSSCTTSSSWAIAYSTPPEMNSGVAEIMAGSDSNHLFLLTACPAISSYYGNSCSSQLQMFYTVDGGSTWMNSFTSTGGYKSPSMNMIVVGNTAYVAAVHANGPTLNSSQITIGVLSFSTSWSSETIVAHGYAGLLSHVGNALYLITVNGPLGGTACVGANPQCDYDLTYYTSVDSGKTWNPPIVFAGPITAYFNEGPSLSSGGLSPNGKISLLYTTDDAQVDWVGFIPPTDINTTTITTTTSTVSITSTTSTSSTTTSSTTTTTNTNPINGGFGLLGLDYLRIGAIAAVIMIGFVIVVLLIRHARGQQSTWDDEGGQQMEAEPNLPL